MGGSALYYLGIYGFGADLSTDDMRATRFAIFDGMEMLGYMVGVFFSPKLNAWGGNHLNYAVNTVLVLASLLYLLFVVKDVERPKVESNESFVKKCLITPLKEFCATMSKKRTGSKNVFLYLLLIVHSIYWGAGAYGAQLYLYMRKVFAGFSGDDYATYQLYYQMIGVCGLLVVLPFAAKVLKWTEATNGLCINISIMCGLFFTTFAKQLWPDFYMARFFTGFSICQYSINRSFITKLVGEDEVGKIFAAVGIITTIFPMILDPVFKQIYNLTLSTFPSAFILVAACFYVINVSFLSAAWCKRKELLTRDTLEPVGVRNGEEGQHQ